MQRQGRSGAEVRKAPEASPSRVPRMDIYIDGPFWPDSAKSEDENRAKLAKKAYDSMVKYSKKNSYEYFQYRSKSDKK